MKRSRLGVQVDKLLPVWRASVSHPGVRIARRGGAKLAVMHPLGGDRWRATVFLAFEEGFRVQLVNSQAEGEEWCLTTMRSWFTQLGE